MLCRMTTPERLPAADSLTLPLPLYESIAIGRMTGRDDTPFTIVAGLDEDAVHQLKERSLDEMDEEIQKNTSDRERFGEGSYEAWYAKGRVPFALLSEHDRQLAALVWFGPKPLGRKSLKHLSAEERMQDEREMDAGNWHTIVYRSYPPFRGTGIMTEFTRFAMRAYTRAFPGAKLWAGIYADNPASIGFAAKLGFTLLEEKTDRASHETIMVRE